VVVTGQALDGRRLLRTLATLALPVVALGLALTWSRGGWLAAGAGLLVLLAARPTLRLRWLALAAGATIAVTIPLLGARWAWHLERLRDLLPAGGPFSRVAVWRVALQLVGAYPLLGTGLATFGPAYDRYGAWAGGPEYAPSAHNLLLHTAAELGIFGVVALVTLLAAGVLALIRWHRRSPAAAPERAGAAVALGATAAFLTHQLVDVTTIAVTLTVGLFLLLGLGAGAAGGPEPPP
jgi:O-antigen ligase